MRFQAILLSLVIFASLLISGFNFVSKQASGEDEEIMAKTQEATIDNSISVFVKDLHSSLSDKITPINQELKQGLTATNYALKENSAVLSQNFVAIKEVLSANINNFFLEASKFDFEDNSSLTSNSALSSKTEFSVENMLGCNPNENDLTSKAVLAKYLDYNFNIFELNTENRWPIASLSKLMSSLVAIEKMDLNEKITITEKAVATEGIAGEFQVGEIFRVKDLVKAMLITSSNDAAVALAEYFGEKEFINEMQKKAAELKMFQTAYLEPTGLSFINQSTINDLSKLITYIYFNRPEILEISRQKETEILDLKSGQSRKLLNINKFAGEPDFIGGKTGYIEEAGRNFIGLFEINGKTVLTITLGAEDSFAETEKLKRLVQNCSDFTPEP